MKKREDKNLDAMVSTFTQFKQTVDEKKPLPKYEKPKRFDDPLLMLLDVAKTAEHLPLPPGPAKSAHFPELTEDDHPRKRLKR